MPGRPRAQRAPVARELLAAQMVGHQQLRRLQPFEFGGKGKSSG